MIRFAKYSIALIVIIALFGCASIETTKVTDLSSKPEGVRVYPTKIYLFVDKEGAGGQGPQVKIVSLPDMENAYDIRPNAFFAKNDFNVTLTDGQVTELKANQDTTAILTFLGDMAKLGAELAKEATGVADMTISGNMGLDSGIYSLEHNGKLKKLEKN